jgi:hypothetical protein
MVARLGDALCMPLEARNQMLTHAGFAVQYPKRLWSEQEMAPVRAAIDYTLERHSPYPAIAVDQFWVVVRMNKPAKNLFGVLGITDGSNLIDLSMSDVLPAVIENWPEFAHHSAQRLRTESAAHGGIPELDRAVEFLSKQQNYNEQVMSPIVPTIYKKGDLRLSLFSTIAQFGTPVDLTLDNIKIELFFPANSQTEEILRAMA